MRKAGNIYILMILALALSGFMQDKPNILIIGDSISLGYTPFVKKNLERKAHISHNPGNAQHTGTGLKKVEEWVGDGDWDIIQFNWGLWDLCYRHPDSKVQGNRDKENGKLTYTIEEYAANLDTIITILKAKTSAELIFLTTTYVPVNEAGRYPNDAIRYNDAAKKVMTKHGVTVNDLYEQSFQIHQKYGLGSDDVHYSPKGYKKLGKQVTRFLKKQSKL